MKNTLVTLIFLCSLSLTACGVETGNATSEKTIKGEPTEVEIAKDDAVEVKGTASTKEENSESKKETPDTKSSEIFDWFDESGLVRGEKKDIDEFSDTQTQTQFEKYGIISMTYAYVKNEPTATMQIIEFQSEEEAVRYAHENVQTVYSFLHENIYVGLRANVKQIENYIEVIKAEKPIKNLERIIYSEEQRQINQALKENDFEQIASIYSSIEDSETREDIYYDELYMSKINFETVYTGTYKSDEHIFGIHPNLYTEPYDDEEKNFVLDGHYVFVHSNYMKKEVKPGEKYVIEGYIESPGAFFNQENDDYGNGGVWSLILTDIK